MEDTISIDDARALVENHHRNELNKFKEKNESLIKTISGAIITSATKGNTFCEVSIVVPDPEDNLSTENNFLLLKRVFPDFYVSIQQQDKILNAFIGWDENIDYEDFLAN